MTGPTPAPEILSRAPGASWPARPGRAADLRLSLLCQLEESQWWPPERLLAQQFLQLRELLRHATRTVPHYRDSLARLTDGFDAPLSGELWERIPVLGRDEAQKLGARLHSEGPPVSHGPVIGTRTSGSTAPPLAVARNDVTQLFWQTFGLREHLWHERDLRGTLAAIRPDPSGTASPPAGHEREGWGGATGATFATGRGLLLDIRSPIGEQAAWLRRMDPDYLLSYPTNLSALAHHFRRHELTLPRLRQLLSTGELLSPSARRLCEDVFGVRVSDAYMSAEAGCIALQCPESACLHVQAEGVLVEVLDDAGRACAPGEIGRVIVTPLHNFAMPLLRYDTGDVAEVGEACPCGRGLPVLRRLLGRRREVAPSFGLRGSVLLDDLIDEVAVARQFQLVRTAAERVTLKLVAERPLRRPERQALAALLCERFDAVLEVDFELCEEIPRAASGKLLLYVEDPS